MVFPLLPALLTGGAALGGALISSSATKNATNAQNNATQQQIALEREQFDRTQANLAPYQAAGQPGLNALTGRLEEGAGVFGGTQDPGPFRFTAEDYKASPAYQLQVDEGLKAITSNMATRGALNSGATVKAGLNYAQDQALKDFYGERQFARGVYEGDRNYLTNRYDQQTGVAGQLATIGGNAAAGVGNAGANMTAGIGNALQNQANATSTAGIVNTASTNNLIGGALDAYLDSRGMKSTAAAYTPAPAPSNAGWYGANLSGYRFQ